MTRCTSINHEGMGQPFKCELELGHDGPHRTSAWAWRQSKKAEAQPEAIEWEERSPPKMVRKRLLVCTQEGAGWSPGRVATREELANAAHAYGIGDTEEAATLEEVRKVLKAESGKVILGAALLQKALAEAKAKAHEVTVVLESERKRYSMAMAEISSLTAITGASAGFIARYVQDLKEHNARLKEEYNASKPASPDSYRKGFKAALTLVQETLEKEVPK